MTSIADFHTTGIVFNEAGNDQDFRIEGDTAANLFVLDAGLDAIQSTPAGSRASAAGATWDAIDIKATTATITGSTNITTATGFNLINIARPTLSAGTALTVTNAATLYIANSPLGGGVGPATITNAYALWIDAGTARFDGNLSDGTVSFLLNTIYRSGGTDVAIADGGTGASDAATAFSNLKQDATLTATGVVEIATAAETTTGTDATRAVSPDGLAGSDYGKRIYHIKVVDDTTTLTTGDGKFYFVVPPELNGMNLVDADAALSTNSSSGTPTIQIANVTDVQDMLSTRITIDANEPTSYTAATPPVINASFDDVATGDILRVDVDVAGTGAKGLIVVLSFQTP